ncbi:MAG: beta-ketoacyl-ACP synthase II [Acidobacteria bacterium]|nr:beta-ketoacyl-ACP synthase II [Acidobacteriota bacterium]MCL5286526.1 beta-ketoacyl-ACP synthase II [Acidobacteriota bacterium]
MSRRVVVTGVGLVCGCGIGTEEVWKNIVAGKSGIGPITLFDASQHDCRIAGEVKNFDPGVWVEKKEQKKMGRFISLAIAASEIAVQMAGLKISSDEEADRTGVYIGSGIGGFEVIEREHSKMVQGGPGRISPFFIPATIVNLAAGHVSIRTGARGPNSATATACSASAHAIGDAFKIIQRGNADAMICGGAEGAITALSVGGFAAMRALSTRNAEPERASRPFDAQRDGFVVGEGSGILILESLEHAEKRGAPPIAEIVGYGMSGDAFHITQPAEEGAGAYRVMMATLRDAGVSADVVDYVNAHGTSTPIGDAIETTAVKRVFGERAKKVAVSSTKSMTGHLLGGAGGLEAGISVLALRDQVLPPTINYENPDPACDLDYVPNVSRKATVNYALSNSFGFGGTNAALLFKRWEGK